MLPQYYSTLRYNRPREDEYDLKAYKNAEEFIGGLNEAELSGLESEIAKKVKILHEKMVEKATDPFKLEKPEGLKIKDLGWLADLIAYRKGFIAYEEDVNAKRIEPHQRGNNDQRENAKKVLGAIKGLKKKSVIRKMLYVAYSDLAKQAKLEAENTASGKPANGIVSLLIISAELSDTVDSIEELVTHVRNYSEPNDQKLELEFKHLPCLIETMEQLTSKGQ